MLIDPEQLEELKRRQRLAKARVIANAHLAAEELAAAKALAEKEAPEPKVVDQVASVFLTQPKREQPNEPQADAHMEVHESKP